jgi:hypothetical protein
MKLHQLLASAIAAVALAGSGYLYAETVVSSTTSDGTITDFGNDSFSIRSETSTEPLRYSFSNATTYVDDAGAPVTVERIRSEHLPVTVHYVKEGDRLVANRVIVHKRVTTTTAPTAVEERKTTTTTTTTK